MTRRGKVTSGGLYIRAARSSCSGADARGRAFSQHHLANLSYRAESSAAVAARDNFTREILMPPNTPPHFPLCARSRCLLVLSPCADSRAIIIESNLYRTQALIARLTTTRLRPRECHWREAGNMARQLCNEARYFLFFHF